MLEKALCTSNTSWEEIERQLRSIGKPPTIRCDVSIQTDEFPPTEESELDRKLGIAGLSPVEEVKEPDEHGNVRSEVKGHVVESELSILRSPTDENVSFEAGLPILPSVGDEIVDKNSTETSAKTIEGACKIHSSGPAEDGVKSPMGLSNGDIFDDMASHTLGISPGDQKVQYSISPKHRPTVLKRPSLERMDSMSHVYGMSPVESTCRKELFGASSLASPSLDSYAVHDHQDGSDVLGMSPIQSPPRVACKADSTIVERSGDNYHHGFVLEYPAARVKELTEITTQQQCTHGVPDAKDGLMTDEQEDLFQHQIKDTKSTDENDSQNSNQATNSSFPTPDELTSPEAIADYCKVQALKPQSDLEVILICREIIDDVVSYALEYAAFTHHHSKGKCLGEVLSDISHASHAAPNCHCSDKSEQGSEVFCQQCKPKGTDSSLLPFEIDNTETNMDTKVVNELCDDQMKLSNRVVDVSVLSLQDIIGIQECEESGKCIAEQHEQQQCVCAMSPSCVDTTKCSFHDHDLSADEITDKIDDSQMGSKASSVDSTPMQCTKCLHSTLPLADDSKPDSAVELVHSTSATPSSGAVGGTPEGASPWDSPTFGKGIASTELSRAIPTSERLALHSDAMGQMVSPESVSSDGWHGEGFANSKKFSSTQISSPSSGRVYPASAINRVTGSRGLMPRTHLEVGGYGGRRGDRRESDASIAICSSCGDELVDEDEVYQWESDDR